MVTPLLVATFTTWREACMAEIVLIDKYKAIDDRLTNTAVGGSGSVGYVWTVEQSAAQSARKKGIKLGPSPRKGIPSGRKGIKLGPYGPTGPHKNPRRKGIPSAQKGKPTGKPAWNSGIKTGPIGQKGIPRPRIQRQPPTPQQVQSSIAPHE